VLPDDIALLRCATNRVVSVAQKLGYELQYVLEGDFLDAELPGAVADAVAWVDTMWEVRTLLAAGGFPDVLRASIFANLYLMMPNAENLDKYGVAMTAYMAAGAQVRGINKPCGITPLLNGLIPPASAVLNPPPIADPDGGVEDTDDDIPEPPAPALRHHAMIQPSRTYGHVVFGSMLATATGLVAKAIFDPPEGYRIARRKSR
jgi:hypothetical protein